jgi:hypothetical protein
LQTFALPLGYRALDKTETEERQLQDERRNHSIKNGAM